MEIPAETPGIPSEYISDHRVTDFPIPNWGSGGDDGPVKKVCAACITPGRNLKRCTCCKAIVMHTYYCNKHCQRKHRKTHVREQTEGASLPEFWRSTQHGETMHLLKIRARSRSILVHIYLSGSEDQYLRWCHTYAQWVLKSVKDSSHDKY
eukprot:scaffold69717_cov32-Attheya_sp.AAC.1